MTLGSKNTGRQNKKKLLPVKNQGDSYTSDIAESEYDNQIVLSPTSLKEEKIKLKNTTFVIKSNTLVSNYDVHYQIMNNVVIYIILTTKD